MRELDLLPKWYRQTLSHRKWVVAQGWITVALGLGLSTWVVLVQQSIHSARGAWFSLEGQLNQSKSQLDEMAVLEERRRQWLAQEQVISRLGLHVEAARLIRALDTAMPREISLSQLQVDTEEKKPEAAPAGRLVTAANQSVVRQLHLTLQGVAPTDLDLANFMSQLSAVPFFEQVGINYVKELYDNGRIMRSFEITFSVPLNPTIGP
jgi:Tfp pilus assembly protein PilN